MHHRLIRRTAWPLAAMSGLTSAICRPRQPLPANAITKTPIPRPRNNGNPYPLWCRQEPRPARRLSDAIVLFDGHNLDQWVSTNDHSPARWKVADGAITVDKSAGNIGDPSILPELSASPGWRIPKNITGEEQTRQQRSLSCVDRPGRCRLRDPDPGIRSRTKLTSNGQAATSTNSRRRWTPHASPEPGKVFGRHLDSTHLRPDGTPRAPA